MFRLFTLHQATRLLPVVDEHLATLQDAGAEWTRLRERLAALPARGVEARNLLQEMTFLMSTVHAAKAELDRLGVGVRDVETGEVEFPSQLGGEVVCLTWSRGQDAITHYHALSGDSDVRPLPASADASTAAGDAPNAARPDA